MMAKAEIAAVEKVVDSDERLETNFPFCFRVFVAESNIRHRIRRVAEHVAVVGKESSDVLIFNRAENAVFGIVAQFVKEAVFRNSRQTFAREIADAVVVSFENEIGIAVGRSQRQTRQNRGDNTEFDTVFLDIADILE